MATYTAKKLQFVNIRPTVVSDVRYDCWFNSSCCYVIICTGVVPEISVTACMLLNALNNSISFFPPFTKLIFHYVYNTTNCKCHF